MTEVGIGNEAVRRAVAVASKHTHVSSVGRITHQKSSNDFAVTINFSVALPNEWRVAGKSPNSGVRAEEPVRFDFPRDYPLLAPIPSLRPDFTRSLPHIQPYMTADQRPVPCIYDGELTELLHHQGWVGLLDHTAIWLERAANSTLMDPEQGWEPVRRDSFRDYVVADAGDIQQVVNRQGGSIFRRAKYTRFVFEEGTEGVYSRVLPERVQVNKDAVPSIFAEHPLLAAPPTFAGKSLAVLVWPGKHPSGKLVSNDTYYPETVSNVKGLRDRARQYGCLQELDSALGILRNALLHWTSHRHFKLLILLLARRPFRLIGSSSEVEICPYVVDIGSPQLFGSGPSTQVCAAAHRHQISRGLLAKMAGDDSLGVPLDWTLLGAGSLGSKIAVHLARAGRGPCVVVDRSTLVPHNAARHALLPTLDDSDGLWIRDKATALCEALRGLKTEVTPVAQDVVDIVRSKKRRLLGKRPWVVVNATASLTVQEALAAADALPAGRVIEVSLFAGGRVGVVAVEGPDRNPNVADLIAEFYRSMADDRSLRDVLSGRDDTSRQQVGQGCGSLTMTMSDGRMSLFAASMAEYLLDKQRNGLSNLHGDVLVGRLLQGGLGLAWKVNTVEPVEIVKMDDRNWHVRISGLARRKMDSEVRNWSGVETGGVLIGRLSEVNRSVYVVDVLSAPEDSVRDRTKFVLGTRGLRRRISSYVKGADGALYCVGTWHSHVALSAPSRIDEATAKELSLDEQSPSVLLIHTPGGFRGLLADTPL